MQRTTSSTSSQDPVASTTPVTLLRFHPGRILSESTQGLMKASAAAIHDEPAKEYIPVRGSILAHIESRLLGSGMWMRARNSSGSIGSLSSFVSMAPMPTAFVRQHRVSATLRKSREKMNLLLSGARCEIPTMSTYTRIWKEKYDAERAALPEAADKAIDALDC